MSDEKDALFDENPAPRSVGAPTEFADAEEVPDWFANVFKVFMSFPLLIGFFCGGLPLICGILWCILQLFI